MKKNPTVWSFWMLADLVAYFVRSVHPELLHKINFSPFALLISQRTIPSLIHRLSFCIQEAIVLQVVAKVHGQDPISLLFSSLFPLRMNSSPYPAYYIKYSWWPMTRKSSGSGHKPIRLSLTWDLQVLKPVAFLVLLLPHSNDLDIYILIQAWDDSFNILKNERFP